MKKKINKDVRKRILKSEKILANKEAEEIKEGLKNIKEGKVTPIEEVARKLGITLK